MKTLLIVEDEKLIRTGIAVMVKRCSVHVDEIIECRNGIEALEILKSRPVDVMFTDIKMPKMDGVELVDRLGELHNKPLVIVISGYDDFSYTVSMLQHGVRDYVLKPIKREKVEEVLQKLEAELLHIQDEKDNHTLNFKNQLKYFLQTDIIPENEWVIAKRQFDTVLNKESWRIAIGSSIRRPEAESQIALGSIDDMYVAFLTEIQAVRWQRQFLDNEGIGLSSVYEDFRQCRKAFEEAKTARKYAFIKGQPVICYENMPILQTDNTLWDKVVQQFVRQFSTEDTESLMRQYVKYYFDIRHSDVFPDRFLEAMADLQKTMLGKYSHMISENMRKDAQRTPLYFCRAEDYIKIQCRWFETAAHRLQEQFGDNQNQNRIREAVRYIHKNYNKDINMAIVSNYVSMNYSLFSIMFKEYTGTNFVNYLKDIRIEAAKHLLVTTDEKIQDISRSIGYDNEKHFMKTFKSLCGVSPSDYRRDADISRQLENEK